MIRSKKPQKEKPTEFAHQSAFVKNQDKYVKSKLLSEKYQTRSDGIVHLANLKNNIQHIVKKGGSTIKSVMIKTTN